MTVSIANRGRGATSDEELVRVAQSDPGSEASRRAAAELFGRYQKAVYLWCFRYVRDHERALDLSQDVFLRAYKGLASFAGRSRFSSWLFAITRNQTLTEVGRVGPLHSDGPPPESLASDAGDPGTMLEEKLGEERVLRMIREALDPLEQRAIWLRCFERLPVREVTRILGIEAESGARATLQKARRKLRAALEKE